MCRLADAGRDARVKQLARQHLQRGGQQLFVKVRWQRRGRGRGCHALRSGRRRTPHTALDLSRRRV